MELAQKYNDFVTERINIVNEEFKIIKEGIVISIWDWVDSPKNIENIDKKFDEFIEWVIKTIQQLHSTIGMGAAQVFYLEVKDFIDDINLSCRDEILINDISELKIILSKTRLINNKINGQIIDKFEDSEAQNIFNNVISFPIQKGSLQPSTSHKAQFLILNALGVFKLQQFKDLTNERKGEFFSLLLNMSFENAKDYLENLYYTKGNSGPKSPYNSQSIKQANAMLDLIGLPPIK